MKQLPIVHIVCVTVVCVCLGLSLTLLEDVPLAPQAIVGFACWLWGKLGFEPTQAVVERIAVRRSRARSHRATAIRRYRYDEHVAYDQGVREHPHSVLVALAPNAHDILHLPLVHAWLFRAPELPQPLPPYIVDMS